MILSCASGQRLAESSNSTEIENFALLKDDGTFFEFFREIDKKAVILVPWNSVCTPPNNIQSIVNSLAHREDLGVYFLNSNPKDTREEIAKLANSGGVRVLLDQSQIAFKRPLEQPVIIDPKLRKITYQGGLDGLLANLGGRPSPKEEKFSFQCLQTPQQWPDVVTYREHVQPIIEKKCMECHQSDSPYYPRNMTDYNGAKSWAAMIRETVRTLRMPAWSLDSYHGEYDDDLSLTEEERGLLVRWVESGAPEGESSKKRTAISSRIKSFRPAWSLGPVTINVPASTNSPWQYDYLGQATSDMWVSAQRLNFKKPVLHHSFLFISPKKFDLSEFEKVKKTLSFIDFRLFNKNTQYAKDGTAIKIPKGSYLYMENHFIVTGKEETVEVQIELAKYEGRSPPRQLHNWVLGLEDFEIPAGEKSYHLRHLSKLPFDVWITDFLPHMHLRGTSMNLRANYPDGRSEILFSVPRFSVKNKVVYSFQKPKFIPANTVLVLTGFYDNSSTNPLGLDFTKPIRPGMRNLEEAEMFATFLHFYR